MTVGYSCEMGDWKTAEFKVKNREIWSRHIGCEMLIANGKIIYSRKVAAKTQSSILGNF